MNIELKLRGKVEITAGHLVFAQKAGEVFAPMPARDIRPGHRLAAPWAARRRTSKKQIESIGIYLSVIYVYLSSY